MLEFQSRRAGLLAAALLLGTAAGAGAQVPGPGAPVGQPMPPPNPESWWTADEPRRPDAYDPLANRRWSKRDEQTRRGFNNGVDASLYRLWGLQPMQSLSLRRGETVYELWYRPTDSTRQAVIRVILRADGETFLQARAGRGCCSPEISRRVDVNVELTGEQRRALAALKADPAWNQPRNVVVSEGETVLSSVCVDGKSYDLTMLDDRRAVHLRRSCDPAEIGSAANIIRGIVNAARGQDPRIDVLFSERELAGYGQSYAQLVEAGGRIRAASDDVPNAPAPPPAERADERQEAEEEILAADRAFAARASAATSAQAFREFMDAEDGLLFRQGGEPVEGAEAIYQHFGGAAPETGKLRWEPAEAWASETGDFGASWGRSTFLPNGASAPTRAFRYLTVWRRDAEGRWKGLMDMGVPAEDLLPTPVAPVAPTPAVPATTAPPTPRRP